MNKIDKSRESIKTSWKFEGRQIRPGFQKQESNLGIQSQESKSRDQKPGIQNQESSTKNPNP